MVKKQQITRTDYPIGFSKAAHPICLEMCQELGRTPSPQELYDRLVARGFVLKYARRPFQVKEIGRYCLPEEEEEPYPCERLAQEDVNWIEGIIGGPLSYDRLRAFLVKQGCPCDPSMSWTDISIVLEMVETTPDTLPKDLMSLAVAINKYDVSRPTLKRAIYDKENRLPSYPKKPGSAHRVSEADLAKRYPIR